MIALANQLGGEDIVEYCPFGVIGAIAPTTNPTETIICNSIAMLTGGNTDPKVRMLAATGGPGIVKAVMSTGKKAIGAGAGNPPVVVDETADIEKVAE